jgi:hypothetical protein
MAKLVKGDNVQNIITDGDVIVTSPSKIGKTLDEVLVEQQSDIDKLKSNVKYIYAYGGVGGSGSGGGGTTEKPISVLITLNGVAVNNGSNAIILDGKGKYKLYVKIGNAGGKNLFMGYTTNGSTVTDDLMFNTLNGENKYKKEIDIELERNGVLNIAISDDEGNNIGYYTQEYIVDSDIFNVTLNYKDINGDIKQYTEEPYECFVSDPNRTDRHFKIDYSILLPEYTEVNINVYIDGVGEIYSGDNNTEISLDDILINNESILQNKYMGTYTLRATLSYKITGKEVVRTRSFLFSIVPSGLYINVRTVGDVLYDDIELLKQDIANGENGIPYKNITQGSSLMLYCKVFEGTMTSNPSSYMTTFNIYDANIESGEIVGWTELNISERETLTEQTESVRGVSVTFPTGGIKRIKIATTGTKGSESNVEKVFYKYVFVKEFTSTCKWFDDNNYNALIDSYFRANQGGGTYNLFPTLSSGDGVFSLTTSASPIVLSQPEWSTGTTGHMCSVITFGIQVSNINIENAKIVDIYTSTSDTTPEYPLRTMRLFTDAQSEINKIAIPTETLNKNDNKKYHLVQIIRNISGELNGKAVYEDSLYIDGLLESVDRSTHEIPTTVTKLVLNNINICYNLINIQYFSPTYTNNGVTTKFNPDEYAYRYWLSYKEKYVNSTSDVRLTSEEKFIEENMHRITFDGTNVVVEPSIVMDIARISDLPTVIFGYNCENGDEKTVSNFMKLMWAGRANGDTNFANRKIDLYWIPERSKGNSINEYIVNIPSDFKDNTGNNTITGNWEIALQGTSTMRNRIKNYSLRIKSNAEREKILFSPKFDVENPRTFLPDVEWTIKADIADSAHANNTSIGKFVNDVCTKIDTNIPGATAEAKKFIKNTLEGIPVLLYFMCTGKADDGVTDVTKVYYFGIYNFNLGRNSYYNLGYTGGMVLDSEGNSVSDFMRVFYNIKDNISDKYYKDNKNGFAFAVGESVLNPNIAIGEIQDNYPEFDFHQYHETLLFKKTDDNNACMFGAENKITAASVADAQTALQNLVKGVAKAGKFCFIKSGRGNDLVTSRSYMTDTNGKPIYNENGEYIFTNNCVNRYDECKIPDPMWQKTYRSTLDEFGSNVVWERSTLCDNVSEYDLRKLITTFIEGETINNPILNFTAASEYYTICMAFGMVDSVLKNMNLKNFRSQSEGPNFYCAFYDMDCALEEANDGEEKISYLAATDYWESTVDPTTGKIGQIVKTNDYWNSNKGGKGFDFTSSYLFAVVKYAKPIFESLKYEENLTHYPQNFWASLRRPATADDVGGGLQSADYFMENYFKSGITTTFEYLASLNYRVKYLYHGETFDSNNNVIDQYLANAAAFNGSRRIKVKNWLMKRLRFLDVMMNVSDLKVPVNNDKSLLLPGPGEEYKGKLVANNDITILHSAFDSDSANTALSSFNNVEVAICAPKYTPFIFASGSDVAYMYLLPNDGEPNLLDFNIQESVGTRFYGSGLFTSVDKIETMFTQYGSIISDNIEKITYGGSNVSNYMSGFTIDAKSATEIKLDIPNMGGELKISDKCISLLKINIANSKFYGSFQSFPNLQEVNISGVNVDNTIKVSGSDYLTGERFYISGRDADHKTKLNFLDISGITGNFNLENTNIESISITNSTDRRVPNFDSSVLSEFTISNDSRLKKLNLNGFRKVSITSCNNLVELTIDDALEELYINLEKVDIDETTSALKKMSLGTVVADGTFDFTNYPNLRKVTLINCDNLEWIKLPDHDVETDGMSNNPKLRWIDTGTIPSFSDTNSYDGKEGTIYEGKDRIPTYSAGHKLIIHSEGAFYNCPNYAMLRSDYNQISNIVSDNENFSKSTFAYTNILVSDECTSLSNTFGVDNTSYLDGNDLFVMANAIRFIEKCVPSNVKANITSLNGCFKGRTKVEYGLSSAQKEMNGDEYHLHPTLSEYVSLNDISNMYDNTGVSFVSKNLLDLPSINNNIDTPLYWDNFISRMSSLNIAKDALYNVSYRLRSYSYINFTIYEYKDGQYKIVGQNSDEPFKICDFFYPFDEGKRYDVNTGECVFDEGIVLYTHIGVLDTFNFDNRHHIDFRGLFNLFPNVYTISSSFNGNLSKHKMDGLLKPCKFITSIVQSFCDDNISQPVTNDTQVIDLYDFFNWEHNTTNVIRLFEGDPQDLVNGFKVHKTVSYENFEKILEKITEYTNLTRLTNIFSYCTITGYEPYKDKEIQLSKTLDNITDISNLFEHCTSDYIPFKNVNGGDKGVYKGGVLNIGRSFFEKLPKFRIAQRTLANTYLISPLTYDYFCKRGTEKTSNTVLIKDGDEYINATIFEYVYNSNIINLKECFRDVKFVNCKNWFDEKDNVTIERNYIETEKGVRYNDRGFLYFIKDDLNGVYVEYTLDNDAIDDCLDNYTDFVPNNEIDGCIWYNHDLAQDFTYYGNIKDGIRPFNPVNTNCDNTIQKTYCCLPPDILYGCNAGATIDGIFSNTNIVGVIPRNLTKKIRSQSMPNIFKNVNIMPNLEYYYDVNGSLDSSILNNITDIVEIYDGSDSDSDVENYCVVFRDEYGMLKKRKPIAGDRSLGQFAYVPANFTTSSNLVNIFNFRYNLPKHWEMPAQFVKEDGITVVKSYKSTHEFNNAILSGELDTNTLPYHSQYYLITDKCVNWNRVQDARNVFITLNDDVDFSNKNTIGKRRDYYNGDKNLVYGEANVWTFNDSASTSLLWKEKKIIENFLIDLNMCGKKNDVTNMLENNGCPIVIKNKKIHLDNFVTGILTIFLNGRVFSDEFAVNDLITSLHKSSGSSSIIGIYSPYYGLGKNIILPRFSGKPSDKNLVFIPIDSEYIYYDFMVNNDADSITNYQKWLYKGTGSLFTTGYNKYTLK